MSGTTYQAGAIQTGTNGNGNEWLPCDGHFVFMRRYPDYLHNVGRRYGGAGYGLLRRPDARQYPGCAICVENTNNGPAGP